jgi:hypothetical protein
MGLEWMEHSFGMGAAVDLETMEGVGHVVVYWDWKWETVWLV